FEQAAGVHALGHGCAQCGREVTAVANLAGREELLQRFKAVHGNKYSYAHIQELRVDTLLQLRCPIHGEFRQRAQDHLTGKGCTPCGRLRAGDAARRPFTEFVQRANAVHAVAYSYDESTYLDDKMRINCPKHGAFLQTPAKHLAGQGCPR
ncbi:hypothetical protein, partial [Glaesserella parasuis]